VKVFNYIFLLISIGIMGFGGYLFTTGAIDWIGSGMAIAMLLFGVFVFLLSVLGICAAQEREDTCLIGDKKCFVGIYSGLLAILILAQIAAAVLVLVAESDAQQFLQDRWNDMKFEQQVDIMEEFECGPFSPTFGEHLLSEEDIGNFTEADGFELTEETLAQLGMVLIEEYRKIVHPFLNSTENTTICRTDEIIEEMGQEGFLLAVGFEADTDVNEKPTDVCFQDCYENFKDDFSNLGVTFIAVVVAIACMEIFLLVASCCALCDGQKRQPDLVERANGAADFVESAQGVMELI